MSLHKLIEAVEAGTLAAANYPIETMPQYTEVMAAYRGSLDAAKALHDALLPGLGWSKTSDGLVVVLLWDAGGVRAKSSSSNPIIARAWLLAILRAMEAEKPE